MRLEDLVIVLLGESGDEGVRGRTRVQKLMYFLCRRLGIQGRFAPYYYGPYSEHVARAVDSLVERGLVEVEVKPFPSDGPFEGKLYRYTLTKPGNEMLVEIKNQQATEHAVRALRKLLQGDPSTRALAVASKLHVLLPPGGRATVDSLRKKARSFGWSIDPPDLKEGADFLISRDFVKPV